MGYIVEPMPKFINFEKCRLCGKCVNGCVFDAKWDATYFVKEALEYGADLICDFNVFEILHDNNEVVGVVGINKNNEKQIFKAKKVVLAAGALNSPIILKNSGIANVGGQIFFDIFIAKYLL